MHAAIEGISGSAVSLRERTFAGRRAARAETGSAVRLRNSRPLLQDGRIRAALASFSKFGDQARYPHWEPTNDIMDEV